MKEKRRKSQTCLLSLLPVVSVTVVGVLQLCVFVYVYVYSSADLFIRQSIFHRTGVDADCCCYARCVCVCVCVRVRTGLMMSLLDLCCQLFKALIAHCFFFPTVFLQYYIYWHHFRCETSCFSDSLCLRCNFSVTCTLRRLNGNSQHCRVFTITVAFCCVLLFYLSLSSPSHSCSSLHNPSNLLSSAAHYSSVSLCLPLSVLTLQVNCCPCLSSINLQKYVIFLFFFKFFMCWLYRPVKIFGFRFL